MKQTSAQSATPGSGRRRSILTVVILAQLVLLLTPTVACTLLLYSQLYLDARVSTANTSYDYCRSIVGWLDTGVRQAESAARNIAANGYVSLYSALPDGPEKTEYYDAQIEPILRYTRQYYQQVSDVQILSTDAAASEPENTWQLLTDSGGNPSFRFSLPIRRSTVQTGVLQLDFNWFTIRNIITSLYTILEEECYIFLKDGTTLYAPAGADEETLRFYSQRALRSAEGYSAVNLDTLEYTIHCETLPLIFIARQRVILTETNRSLILPDAVLVIALIIICLVISCSMLYFLVFRRLVRLSRHMDSVQSLTTYAPVQGVEGADEIGRLARSYNAMLGRMTELSTSARAAELLSQKTAYNALAAQIKPHFLYNTLESLRMMAQANRDYEVADMLFAFGRMLRLSIIGESSTGTLKTEMEHANYYLQLRKMRMDDMLQYEIEPVEEPLKSFICPRFIVQPLIENSIRHGLRPQEKPGFIRVRCARNETGPYIVVQDNGVGIPPEKLIQLRAMLRHSESAEISGESIGLSNVQSRLRLFYGPKCGITIESTPGEDTECIIQLNDTQTTNLADH